MAILDDGSLPALYDFALDGVGYLVEWEYQSPPWREAYTENAPDLIIERMDQQTVEQLTENKSDYLIWRSQRSWHQGAGQLRFDAATSNENAYDSSVGIDFTVPGQATLVSDITTQATLGGTPLDSRKVTVSGGYVFCEDLDSGAYRLNKFTPGAVATAFTFSTSGTRPYGLASDGKNVYIALGADGVDSGLASGSSSTHFSDADVRAISWERQQLVGAGLKTGTQWRLLAIAAGAGSSDLLDLPDGFVVEPKAIASAGGFTYFGAHSDHISVVYGWDGTHAPFVCLELPEGDQVMSLCEFAGGTLMIGCRRLVRSGLGLGALWEGTPDPTAGFITAVEVQEIGTADNSVDYAITSIGSHSKHLHYTWVPFGLGLFLPEFTSYGRHLGDLNGVETKGGDITLWQETHVFSAGDNVYYETEQFVTHGHIVGSIMDWNIDANKIVLKAEAGFTQLPNGTTVAFEYSVDEGTTWVAVGTATAGDNVTGLVGVSAKNIKYRVTLTTDTGTKTLTPTLKKAGLGGWYGDKARSQHIIAVKAYDRMTLKNGTMYPNSGPELSETIHQAFRDLRQTSAVVDFQPPGWGTAHFRNLKVNVRSLETKTTWRPGAGFGKTILATIMEIPIIGGVIWSDLAASTWGQISTKTWSLP